MKVGGICGSDPQGK